MTRLLPLLVLLAACGPEEVVPPPECPEPPAQVNPAFAGQWTGRFQLTTESGHHHDVTQTMGVAVNDGAVIVAGVCPGDGGLLPMSGSGKTVTWDGEAACANPLPLPGCALAVTYRSAIFALYESIPELSVTLAGTATCEDGSSSPVIVRFTGTR